MPEKKSQKDLRPFKGPVIKVAKNAGFCFGVKRAVDSVFDVINKYEHIYTLGELIHNKNVIAELEQKGVHIASDVQGIPKRDSTLVVVPLTRVAALCV